MSLKSKETENPRILGIERDPLEEFLRLIRDAYPSADKAAFFLERHAGVTNIAGITNLRDALSHLASFLREDITDEKRREQLTNAKEHFRRSILEPYEVAFLALLKDFGELYENYKKNLIPVREDHLVLKSAPTQAMIDAQMNHIKNLADSGRASKAENDWTRLWDSGVKHYIQAYDELFKLYAELETHWNKWEHIKEGRVHRHGIKLHYTGIVLAVVIFIAGVLVDHKFEIVHRIVDWWKSH
jgi:hypothetical protein